IYTVDLFDCPPFRMFTANDCHRAVNILEQKKFEPMSMALWCRLVPKATWIVDIGAQVGVYSLAAAALRKDIPIHAFEPNPYAYARLRVHKSLNGFDNIVEHREAVAYRYGVAKLYVLPKGLAISSGGSLLNGDG